MANMAPSAAAESLSRALTELHARAGKPSTRAIAAAVGGLSHTTVSKALNGTRIPSWPVLSRIIRHLGGNPSDYEDAYVALREPHRPEANDYGSSGDISVFASYARVDNDAAYGRVTKFLQAVSRAYESYAGAEVRLFVDEESIPLGTRWRQQIALGLESSIVLIAFVSPAYLRSPMCRSELAEFTSALRANASRRLIPLWLVPKARLDVMFADDEVYQDLLEYQGHADASALRTAEEGSSEWVTLAYELAEGIDEILTKASRSSGVAESPLKNSDEGTLEKLAGIEDAMPEFLNNANALSAQIEALGKVAREETPNLVRATSFSQRLAVTNRLAEKMDPIAGQLKRTGDEVYAGITRWDYLVRFAIEALRGGRETDKSKTVEDFFRSVESMATSGSVAMGQIRDMSASVGRLKGMSARLDKPLALIQDVTLRLGDSQGLFKGWLDEIELLRAEGLLPAERGE